MKPKSTLRHFLLLPAALIGLLVSGHAHAATITQDFESAPIGTTAPTGWTTVGVGANGTYETAATTGNPDRSGNLDWTGANTTAPSVYLVIGGTTFDATKSISGSYDFYVVESGDYSAANFVIGDVQNGLSGNAGEFINVYMREIQFGARANVYDGAGTLLFNGSGKNNYAFKTNEWVNASFTWTPTSGTTGDFSVLLDSPSYTNSAMTVTGYTFDSAKIFFGFGTVNAPVRFDNINITGTAVPELHVALLGSLGLLALLRRRR